VKDLITSIRQKARANPRRIVLPETEDPRTLQAIDFILRKKIAKVIAIGSGRIKRRIKASNTGLLEIIDPEKSGDTEGLANTYCGLRRHKGMTIEEARRKVRKEHVIFGALLVRLGMADGLVAGASHTTPNVVRTVIHCIPIDRASGVVSSAFVMLVPKRDAFLFADCGVNPDPDSNQLAGIAIEAAKLFRQLVRAKPRVAFLSYSTKGSASGPRVDKVVEALKIARGRSPGLLIDGELQADSAISPDVARIKCPGSEIAGRANCLIFPSLESGNIAYKLVQRLTNARAIGPLLMGTTKPASDLSRGCSAEDIIDAVAITSLRV